jgi:hypothetical protein
MNLLWKLAPFADNYDMWIAIAFCFLPIIPLLILAYISHRSGSQKKVQVPGAAPGVMHWVPDVGNVPFHKIAWFQFALVWLLLGSIFFFGLLWPDYHDVWFILDK